MFHFDQVPLAFVPAHRSTYNKVGRRCQLATPHNEDEKRFCSLQVCICANADTQVCKLEIIFRGTGQRIDQAELDHYTALPNLRIRWQAKAYADESTTIAFLEDFRSDTAHLGEVMLGLGNFKAHLTLLCRTFAEYMGICLVFTPPNCTDCVSPVDKNVGQTLKAKINAQFEDAYALHFDRWNRPPTMGGLTTSEKRMLLATWASNAWTDLCDNHQSCIKSSFVKSGFLVAKDGSENHLIALHRKGEGKYDF